MEHLLEFYGIYRQSIYIFIRIKDENKENLF